MIVDIVAWVLQIGLGIFFIGHSWVLLAARPDQLRSGNEWVLEIPRALRLFGGVADGLAAIGLVLPWATGVLRWLTPLAAVGLVVLMIGAIVTHAVRGERRKIVTNVVLLIVSAVVAYLRWSAFAAA